MSNLRFSQNNEKVEATSRKGGILYVYCRRI